MSTRTPGGAGTGGTTGRTAPRGARARMTGQQRREQLLDVGRGLFAEKGVEGTSVEEIAASAGVSKPVVYEHFGGKEGLYAVVVDREMQTLQEAMTSALTSSQHPRQILEVAALALLDYIENSTDGFRILVRDSPLAGASTGGFASLMSDVASRVEYILTAAMAERGFDTRVAPLYAQMLVGMVAMTGQFWLDHRKPGKAEVAAHIVNLAWNGLTALEPRPTLTVPPEPTRPEPAKRVAARKTPPAKAPAKAAAKTAATKTVATKTVAQTGRPRSRRGA